MSERLNAPSSESEKAAYRKGYDDGYIDGQEKAQINYTKIFIDRADQLNFKYDCLRNQMAELSLKIHKIESSLREFEKQRVDPLREGLACLTRSFEAMGEKG